MKIQKKQSNFFTNPFAIASVVDNDDPEKAYRIKVRIPVLHDNLSDDTLPWAARVGPTFLGFGDSDIDHSIPEIGTKVLVLAISDNPNSLLYLGTLYAKNSATPSGDDYLGSYGIYTHKGEFIGIDKIKTTFKMIYEGKIDISKIKEAQISVEGPIKINVKGPLSIDAKSTTTLTAQGLVNIKSSEMVNIESGAMTTIKGGPVTIEKGTISGFNCLQKCLFTGIQHVSPTSE